VADRREATRASGDPQGTASAERLDANGDGVADRRKATGEP
jgi:hypothetical protein